MKDFKSALVKFGAASTGKIKTATAAILADPAMIEAIYAAVKKHAGAQPNTRGRVDWNALLQQLMPSFIALLAKIPPRS